MAYNVLTHKILSGSLSLLPPSDLIDEIDAIALSNFRVDQAGQIRSRQGTGAAISTIAGPAHTMHKGVGHRYQGGSTTAYRDGVSIATGLDGTPVGFASSKKYEWIMNRSAQKKDTGTTAYAWGITAPSGAPTVALGAEKVTTVDGFETAAGWTASTGLTLADDGADKKSGTNSMKCSFTQPGVYSATKTGLALNLTSVGGSTGADDDKFRIWVRVTDPFAVQTITLTVDVSAGTTFDTDYYTIAIPKKHWKKVRGNWVQLEIRRTQTINDILVVTPAISNLLKNVINPRLTEGETVNLGDLPTSAQTLIAQNALTFARVGSTAGRDWSTVTGLKIDMEGVGEAGTDVRFDLWEVFGSVVGTIEGSAVQYYYTYVNADSHESNPSPVSTALAFNRRSASVTVALSADAQVTGINIYRTGGTLGAVYKVNSSPEANTNHAYVDSKTDDDLTTLGITMQTDLDLPPACSGLVGEFFGRLIAFSTSANPNRFFWTKLNKPYGFPGAASAAGNWADVGDSGYAILAATRNNRIIYFYKGDSIWRLIGDPGDVDGLVERCDHVPFGILGPQAVCTATSGNMIATQDGIYEFNGDTARKISTKIDPIFKGIAVTLASGISYPAMTATASDRAKTVLGYSSNTGLLRASYCETGSSSPNVTLVYNAANDTWGSDTRGFTSLYDEAGTMLAGTSGGAIEQLETGTSDNGSGIPLVYQSKYFNAGISDAKKTFEDLVIEADTGGATLTVAAYNEAGTALTVTPSTFSTSAGVRTKTIFQFESTGKGVQAYSVSIRITGTANTSNPTVIFGSFLHYYPEQRSAFSFDSDETNLGIHGVKLIRSVELDIENSGTASLQVYTDLPGSSMASRETISIASGTGRRVVPKMMASQYKGYLNRFVLDGSGYNLYGLRAEVKPIGDYIIANEIWDSDELTWGSTRVKSSRALQIDLENSADVTVTVFTDLPGGVLALRDTLTITANATRRVVQLPLGAERQGYLWRIKMTSTADFILYSVESEIREIGTYISGASGKTYDSNELDAETERVKFFKELEVDLSSSATVNVTLLTDLPGGVLASRATPTITSTAGVRKTVKIRLAPNLKGRLYQVKMTSSADFVIYGLRCFLKMVGEPHATPWQWVGLPYSPTAMGIWNWQGLPVVPTNSNEWRFVDLPMDAVA